MSREVNKVTQQYWGQNLGILAPISYPLPLQHGPTLGTKALAALSSLVIH